MILIMCSRCIWGKFRFKVLAITCRINLVVVLTPVLWVDFSKAQPLVLFWYFCRCDSTSAKHSSSVANCREQLTPTRSNSPKQNALWRFAAESNLNGFTSLWGLGFKQVQTFCLSDVSLWSWSIISPSGWLTLKGMLLVVMNTTLTEWRGGGGGGGRRFPVQEASYQSSEPVCWFKLCSQWRRCKPDATLSETRWRMSARVESAL